MGTVTRSVSSSSYCRPFLQCSADGGETWTSLIPRFIVVKKIRRKVGIDENTHQIIDKYYFGVPFVDTKWIYSRPLWKLFNSFSRKQLPEKEWEVW